MDNFKFKGENFPFSSEWCDNITFRFDFGFQDGNGMLIKLMD